MNSAISVTEKKTMFWVRLRIDLFFRWLIFSVILFGVPSVIVWKGFEEIDRERQAAFLLECERSLDSALSTIERWKDPQFFFEALMDRFRERVFPKKSGARESVFKKYSNFLKRRFPDVLEFTFLDREGNAIPKLCDRVPPQKLLRKFFSDLIDFQSDSDSALRKNWNLYRPFFGNLIEEPNNRLFKKLTEANNSDRHAYVYVANHGSIQKNGMFIVHLNLNRQWEELVARYCLDLFRYRNAQKNVRLFLFMEKIPDAMKSGSKDLGVPESDFLKAYIQMTRNNEDFIELNGNLWGSRILKPGMRLFAVYKETDKSFRLSIFQVFRIGIFLLFGFLSILAFQLIVSNWNPYFSIRFKMILLFLYTAGIPLTIMLITANRYLSERRQFLERKMLFDQERALIMFDEKFPRIFGILEPLVLKEVEGPFAGEAIALETLQKRLTKIEIDYQPGVVRVVNPQGKTVFSAGSSPESKPLLEKLLKEVSRDVFRTINYNAQVEPESTGDQLSGAASDLFGFSSQRIFGDLARNRGRLKEFTFASFHQTMGVFATLNPSGRAIYLTLIGWEKRFLEEKYIAQYLSEANRGVSELLNYSRFYCNNRANMKKSLPPVYPYSKMIRFSMQKLSTQGKTVFDRIEKPDKVFLTTALHGKNLKEFDLIASTPDDPIQAILKDLRQSIAGICFGVTAISFALGFLLSRKFLTPVGYLSEGIEALRQRKFNVRIPVLDKDELGDLSLVFNEVISGMADLEVARVLQENFFPKEKLSLGPVSVFGSCQTATQVGGDYFDYFLLGDSKVAVIIGDVAGHGVPAALVVAMAKVLIADHSRELGDPAAVMTVLNDNILAILKRKRIMSCFIMIVDIVQMNILFTNAGHVYPAIMRNGKIEELAVTRYPLGLKTNANFQNVTLPVEHGDRLLLFTDGLVEAVDRKGEAIGYKRLYADLPGLLLETPEKSEEAIRSWHSRLSPLNPPDDDVTVVVINIQ